MFDDVSKRMRSVKTTTLNSLPIFSLLSICSFYRLVCSFVVVALVSSLSSNLVNIETFRFQQIPEDLHQLTKEKPLCPSLSSVKDNRTKSINEQTSFFFRCIYYDSFPLFLFVRYVLPIERRTERERERERDKHCNRSFVPLSVCAELIYHSWISLVLCCACAYFVYISSIRYLECLRRRRSWSFSISD